MAYIVRRFPLGSFRHGTLFFSRNGGRPPSAPEVDYYQTKPPPPELQQCPTPPDEHETRKTLSDYFNLCAEEYLFNKEGRILPDAWRAWCKGMTYHIEHKNIIDHWKREEQSDSYYGLTLEIIRREGT